MYHKKMTYALKNEVLTHISEVEKGLKCNCVCPACGAVLVAHKGDKISHHFKHYNTEECEHGYETSLHMMAKEIIAEEKRIVIPEVVLEFHSYKEPIIISPSIEIKIDNVELEKRLGNIVPDIIIYCGNSILLVEIFVTHKIDEQKLLDIAKENISVMEINLSKIDRNITKDELRKILISDTHEKHWVYNKILEKIRKEFRSVADRLKSYVYNYYEYVPCPVTHKRKRVRSDYNPCYECKYCISDYDNTLEECFDGHEYTYPPAIVLCTGRRKINTLYDLKRYIKDHYTE